MPERSSSTGPSWRARPVFISSTFRDMHAERDYLRSHVFPQLEERLRGRHHYLEAIDLRLGVETASLAEQQSRELKVLKVCLSEIERSRPFLIVLLGDRYGWVPPAERIAGAADEAGFRTEPAGKSVTALEIEFGILKKDPAQRQRSLFYFRDPLPYERMPPEKRAEYSDEYSADPEVRAGHARLLALKRRIAEDPELKGRVRHYRAAWDGTLGVVRGLEAWGRQVVEEMWADLDAETREFQEQAPQTPEAEEHEALLHFVEEKARDFQGRTALAGRLLALARSPAEEGAPWGACITGAPGSGKSALFAWLYRELSASPPALPGPRVSLLGRLAGRQRGTAPASQPNDAPLVLAQAAGSTPRSAQVDLMLRRWVAELAALLGKRQPVAETASTDDVQKAFAALLHGAAARRRVVLLVDGLDQFEPTPRGRYLTWLPRPWPANARLIATALPGTQAEALSQRDGVESIDLPPLGEAEAAEIGCAVWVRYHRQCSPDVLARVLARLAPDGAPAYGNPLWLTLAMEQLNLLDADDFGRAGQDLHGLLLGMAASLPPDVAGLYGSVLARAEKVYGAAWARATVCLIAVSQAGWREADLRALLPRAAALLFPQGPPLAWDALQFASLRRGLGAQLAQRGSHGRWDFSHSQMREAVQRRYVADPDLARRLHAAIAGHLLALPPEDPLRDSETMLHLYVADDRPRAARFLAALPAEFDTRTQAARTLGAHILAAGDAARNDALAWTVSLAELPGLDADVRWRLARHVQYDLNGILESEARLGVRLRLLEAAAGALAGLVTADQSRDDWQRDLSANHERLGDVLQAQGDLAGALRSYQASLDIRERLAPAHPSEAGWQYDLALSHERVGDVLAAQGDQVGALQAFRASLAICQRCAAADPSNPVWQHALSVGRQRVGGVLAMQGDLSQALEDYRASLAILQRLVAADPANADWQRDLSASHSIIGDVLQQQGDLMGALEAYRAGLAVFERLAAADPTNASWQRDLSLSHERVGDASQALGDLPRALGAYRAGQATLQGLVAADPSNADWQRELSLNYQQVGDVLRMQGDLPGALVACREGLAIQERLAAADPTNADQQDGLAASRQRVGLVLEAQGELAGALQAYRESLAVLERLASADPTNTHRQGGLAFGRERVGDVLQWQGDLAGALETYRGSLAIRERLVAADPTDAGWQRELCLTYVRVGDVLQVQGDLVGALRAYRRGLAYAERLAAMDPANADWQRNLSVSQGRIGDVLQRQGDLAGALKAYRVDLKTMQRLVPAYPSNASWQRELSLSHERVGDVMEAQGDLAGALQAYRQELTIRERLVAMDPTNAEWQRYLMVSHLLVARVLARMGDPEEMEHRRRAHGILSAMKQAGTLLARDEEYYLQLGGKLER